jgi:hypothetical protein
MTLVPTNSKVDVEPKLTLRVPPSAAAKQSVALGLNAMESTGRPFSATRTLLQGWRRLFCTKSVGKAWILLCGIALQRI